MDQLIALDADDIEDLRQELADARLEVLAAIDEVEEAKQELDDVPGGEAILKVAFSVAGVAVSKSTDKAFEKLRYEIDLAEEQLIERQDQVGAEEFTETQLAIDVLREGIADIEVALADVIDALRV